jgi:hemerythrin superfamily protein
MVYIARPECRGPLRRAARGRFRRGVYEGEVPLSSFQDVLALHRELDELFFQHQRALLDFDFRGARERLAEYESALLAHMRDEEGVLLPLYRERDPEPARGGRADFFLLEHAKMRRHLAHFREQLPRLAGLPEPSRALLKLLDQETTYKHLVEHHDTREERHLYPTLERVTSDAERAELLGRVLKSRARG